MGHAQTQGEAGALENLARQVLELADDAGMVIATAESCTGGQIASVLTEVEGLSNRVHCSFVTYSDAAKNELLGIPLSLIEAEGAVSKDVVLAMAGGALARSSADVAVAVSGYTGSAGKHENGLVHFAVCKRDGYRIHRECHFGPVEREEGKAIATRFALDLLRGALAR
ncbi:MAG: CinA family protein [Novosphingobium sp.]